MEAMKRWTQLFACWGLRGKPLPSTYTFRYQTYSTEYAGPCSASGERARESPRRSANWSISKLFVPVQFSHIPSCACFEKATLMTLKCKIVRTINYPYEALQLSKYWLSAASWSQYQWKCCCGRAITANQGHARRIYPGSGTKGTKKCNKIAHTLIFDKFICFIQGIFSVPCNNQ